MCKCEIMRTTHENNTQKQQHEVCRCKTATATPACTGEGGRVGEWGPK